MSKYRRLSFLIVFVLFFSVSVFSETKTVNLIVAYKTVNFAHKKVQAISINNQIPGPTLYFKNGEHVVINVLNHLNVGTTLHWHGVLVPWKMDGVAGITQSPIPPGKTFQYHFTLRQSGTYWYHSHDGLQEQQGEYGAFIISPKHSLHFHVQKDFVVMLSDWTNKNPETIYADLQHPKHSSMKMSMNKMPMKMDDLSDVHYDAFLLNGKNNAHPWLGFVKKGDAVRLRFIDAGASTNFNVKIPGYDFQIISVDGQNVRPLNATHFLIAPGETYDVLVKIKNKNPAIIYAESMDSSGAALGALIENTDQKINFKSVKPFSSKKIITGSHYKNLIAAEKTNNPKTPIAKIIRMHLTGSMTHYVWSINNVTFKNAKPIIFQHGKRYRFIFINDTMMFHPMHIHGHFFILRNGHGAFDPLLHTIDVAPGETITADVDANEKDGHWFFHCHNLYHMEAGMARLIEYQK